MPISSLMVGALCTAAGTIVSLKSTRRNRGVNIFEVILHDGKGYLRVKWFNQPYMQRNVSVGQELVVSGVVRKNTYSLPPIEMDSPSMKSCLMTKSHQSMPSGSSLSIGLPRDQSEAIQKAHV